MAQSLQVIYGCDHYIQYNNNMYDVIKMHRQSDGFSPDKLPDNINIVRIDKIYKMSNNEEIVYYENYHYKQTVSPNIIEWVPTAPNIPNQGEEYFIQCFYVQISVEKYKQESCPRCGGNGWYISLVNETGMSVKKLDGLTKLLQEFIKVLYTDKGPSGYGSNINDVIATSVYDPSRIYSEIISSILDCAEQIKTMQKNAIFDGIEIDDSERLLNVVINKILYSREETCFYVSISIYNVLGESVKFNFKV